MRKIIIGVVLISLFAGCTIKTMVPEKNEKPKEIIKVIEFEPREIEAMYIDIVKTDKLNVRKKPDLESDKVGQVFRNDKFQVVNEVYDSLKRVWYEIEFEAGKTGYVAGWFCAKTKIVIHVEADKATVLDVKALPAPVYVDNPFAVSKVSVGDQVVGLPIKEIQETEAGNRIIFDGEVELTGVYYYEQVAGLERNMVRFVPDEASSVLLPRTEAAISGVWFYLTDDNGVATDFGEVGASAPATLVIKDYTIGYGAKSSYNQATLVKKK